MKLLKVKVFYFFLYILILKQDVRSFFFIKDLRLQLGATDYGSLLQNEPSPIATSTIAEKLTQSLVEEFNYVRSNAVQPLTKFLEYIT